MRSSPNQYHANQQGMTMLQARRIAKGAAAADEARRVKLSDRIDLALACAGGLMAFGWLILKIMGAEPHPLQTLTGDSTRSAPCVTQKPQGADKILLRYVVAALLLAARREWSSLRSRVI